VRFPAGLGFHALSDNLDIQISVIHLGLQTLGYVVSLDIARADRCFYTRYFPRAKPM
jgi:hypothetical protein